MDINISRGSPLGANVDGSEIAIASQAEGDILYFNGTAWVKLAKGAALQYLRQNAGLTAPEYATFPNIPGAGEGHIKISPLAYSAVIQGTWTITYSATDPYQFMFKNGEPGNVDDELNYKVYLAVGTYSFLLVHRKEAGCGIAHILIDDAEVGTIDGYGTAAGVLSTITNINIATAGLKTLKVRMHSKNGSSSGYTLDANEMVLYRTA